MTDKKSFASMMDEKRVFYPPAELAAQAYIKTMDDYKKMYKESIEDPEAFWGKMAEELDWFKKWDKVLVEDFANAKHEWFVGGKLNVTLVNRKRFDSISVFVIIVTVFIL